MIRKTQNVITCYLLLLSLTAHPALAGEEFNVTYKTGYSIRSSGTAQVSQEVSLTNNLSQVYAKSYSFYLEGKKPSNAKAIQAGEDLPVSVEEEGSKTKISINFPDALVGKGKIRTFTLSYQILDAAQQNGQVWEINVPRLGSPENIDEYTLTLNVPAAFGKAAYISPNPRQTQTGKDSQSFIFYKDDLLKAGVVAAFGEFQVFAANLTYHLENPYSRQGLTEIALVPDTAFQRVYYEELDPKPANIRLDKDGNWLATYLLSPNEKQSVKTKVTVQVFAQPQQNYPEKTLLDPQNRSLASTEFWQASNDKIKRLAGELKNPRSIYNWVTSNLVYDHSRVKTGTERLGALFILENPQKAVCMEFTDLFIALSRAAGIPAREINGYAHTEDKSIQPLSLIADVLHAWPEYWDEEKGVWRGVDPTWENTTGGVDFFDKFDLSHITFAIHGQEDSYPAPAGAYKFADDPQKDVLVEFGKLPLERSSKLEVKTIEPKIIIPFLPLKLKLEVSNPGPTALYDQDITVKENGIKVKNSNLETIDFLAPFSSKTYDINLHIPLSRSDASLTFFAQDNYFYYNIPYQKTRLIWLTVFFIGLLLLLLLLLGGFFTLRYVLAKYRKTKEVRVIGSGEKTSQ